METPNSGEWNGLFVGQHFNGTPCGFVRFFGSNVAKPELHIIYEGMVDNSADLKSFLPHGWGRTIETE